MQPLPSTSTTMQPLPSTSTTMQPLPSTSTTMQPLPSTSTRTQPLASTSTRTTPLPTTPPLSTTPTPPRLQWALAQGYSPVPSSPLSSDWSDSSADKPSLGHDAGLHRFCSRRQSAKNLSDLFEVASPSKSPRLAVEQSSVNSDEVAKATTLGELQRTERGDRLVDVPSPSPAQQSHLPLKKRVGCLYHEMFPQNLDETADGEICQFLGSSEMERERKVGGEAVKTRGGGTPSAAGDVKALGIRPDNKSLEAKNQSYAKVAMTSADVQLHESKPIQMKKPMENGPDLLLCAEESALPRAVTTVGSAMPQLVQLIATGGATSQSVQSPTATATVGSAVPQLVGFVTTYGPTFQSVHSPNLVSLNLLTNTTVNPTVSLLPVTSSVATYRPTFQSVHSPDAVTLTLSTNRTVNPTVSWSPITSSVELVAVMAPLTYELPGAQQNGIVWPVGSAPMTTTTDLLTGSPCAIYPYSSSDSINPTVLLTSSTQSTGVGATYSQQLSESPQTITAVKTAAAESSMTGKEGSAPTVQTTNRASSSLRQDYPDSSPITTSTDPLHSKSKVEITMLSDFRESSASQRNPNKVERTISNVAHKKPATSPVSKIRDRLATTQDKAMSAGDTRASKLKKIRVKKHRSREMHSLTFKDASVQTTELLEVSVNKTESSSQTTSTFRNPLSKTQTGGVESRRAELVMKTKGSPPEAKKRYPHSLLVTTLKKNFLRNTTVVESPASRSQTTASTSSVDVSMQSNLAEFRASKGAHKMLTKTVSSARNTGKGTSSVTTKADTSSIKRVLARSTTN